MIDSFPSSLDIRSLILDDDIAIHDLPTLLPDHNRLIIVLIISIMIALISMGFILYY
jgi:hypothetical protein